MAEEPYRKHHIALGRLSQPLLHHALLLLHLLPHLLLLLLRSCSHCCLVFCLPCSHSHCHSLFSLPVSLLCNRTRCHSFFRSSRGTHKFRERSLCVFCHSHRNCFRSILKAAILLSSSYTHHILFYGIICQILLLRAILPLFYKFPANTGKCLFFAFLR